MILVSQYNLYLALLQLKDTTTLIKKKKNTENII